MDKEHLKDIGIRLIIADKRRYDEDVSAVERWWAAYYYNDITAILERVERLKREAYGPSTDSG